MAAIVARPWRIKRPVPGDELDLIRRSRELDALRIVAVARLGVAAVMIAAQLVGSPPKWPQFNWVPWAYGVVAVGAAVLLFSPLQRRLVIGRTQLVLLLIDVAAIFTYKIATADGTYVPLLVLTLLPIMVVLDVSWRRAAAALVVIAGTFAVEIFTDPVVIAEAGRSRAAMATAVFVFLCGTVFLAVYAQSRQLDEITDLSASRQALLVDLMAASDDQQRRISEYIHDGPLQSVLMARQDITGVLKKQPNEALERALAGLKEATDQMREATFELHPAVLGGAGLARALQQLAAANSARSGIDITADWTSGLLPRRQSRHQCCRSDGVRRGPGTGVERGPPLPRHPGQDRPAGRRRRLPARRHRRRDRSLCRRRHRAPAARPHRIGVAADPDRGCRRLAAQRAGAVRHPHPGDGTDEATRDGIRHGWLLGWGCYRLSPQRLLHPWPPCGPKPQGTAALPP